MPWVLGRMNCLGVAGSLSASYSRGRAGEARVGGSPPRLLKPPPPSALAALSALRASASGQSLYEATSSWVFQRCKETSLYCAFGT